MSKPRIYKPGKSVETEVAMGLWPLSKTGNEIERITYKARKRSRHTIVSIATSKRKVKFTSSVADPSAAKRYRILENVSALVQTKVYEKLRKDYYRSLRADDIDPVEFENEVADWAAKNWTLGVGGPKGSLDKDKILSDEREIEGKGP